MLSYQHGYHAGGPADIHKHRALAAVLSLLTQKARPLTYVETHAGRGLYDLTGDQAEKTGEWKAGIGKAERDDHPYWTALDRVRAHFGPDSYPGSPLIAQALLRDQDRCVLMELHPAEHAALVDAIDAEVHKCDGFEGALAMAPPKPRRGLVLIDPSYEVKTEYIGVVDFVKALLMKWPEPIVMIWYPILPDARHRPMVEALNGVINEVRFPPHKGRGMEGSGLVILNAPYGIEKVIGATE
jgi:23S rRNA (adenine2030-N6)-methyltransferase